MNAPVKEIKLVRDNAKGSVVVLMAMAFTALLGFAALVFDVGTAYLQDLRISNAVDAAALAGIQALPDSPAQAYQLAQNYAVKNGVVPEELTIEIAEDGRGISVQAKRCVEYSFAPVLGISSVNLQREAGAELAAVSVVWGAAPFGIQEHELHFGEEYVLKAGAENDQSDGAEYSGWFGALRLGGNGANTYEENIKKGFQGWLAVGDIITVENGNMSNPTVRGVNYRISQCKHTPACTSEHFAAVCSRLIKVPVVAPCGTNDLLVKGFAMFFLERVDGQGNQNNVWGKFVRMCLPGETAQSIADDCDFGVYSIHLSY